VSQVCSPSGACCTPVSCLDRHCGDDGCGGLCGECTGDSVCDTTAFACCVPETDPEFCTRLSAACGSLSAPDNCHEPRTVAECGPCLDGFVCADDQTCQASDGTGADAGAVAAGPDAGPSSSDSGRPEAPDAGALVDGGATADSGALAPADAGRCSSTCTIGGEVWCSGETDPTDPCQRCSPSTNGSDWTPCGQGYACTASGCTPDLAWAQWPVPPESPSSYTAGADTVVDGVTGLVWQRAVPAARLSFDDAKTYCSGLALGGRTGWSLPTTIELLSLVDTKSHAPAINSTAFPSTPSVAFWSATGYEGIANEAWAVQFNDGGASIATTSTLNAVRCVIRTSGASGDHYTIGSDFVVDNWTGLTWQRTTDLQVDWPAAVSTCQSLSQDGVNTWRLPTKKELETLVDRADSYPAIDLEAFPSAPVQFQCWSGTAYAPLSLNYWFVDFDTGESAYEDGQPTIYQFCVH
jgi:hypothetical protein